jgi:hypothetical protein
VKTAPATERTGESARQQISSVRDCKIFKITLFGMAVLASFLTFHLEIIHTFVEIQSIIIKDNCRYFADNCLCNFVNSMVRSERGTKYLLSLSLSNREDVVRHVALACETAG